MHLQNKDQEEQYIKPVFKIPWLGFFLTAALFLILAYFVVTNFTEVEYLLELLNSIEIKWMVLSIALLLLSYYLAGLVWKTVARDAHFKINHWTLMRISVEQISINQLIPAGGIAGHTLIVQAMRKLGLPMWLAMEMVIVDLLGFYIAYSVSSAYAMGTLWLHNGMTPIVSGAVSLFFMLILSITLLILLLLYRRVRNLPPWIRRQKIIIMLLEAIAEVSKERVLSKRMLIKAALIRISIFITYASILWTMMMALGVEATFTTVFAAYTIGSIAASVSFWPAGFGSFEAACSAILILLGIPAEPAIAATLLLRALTLWLPLIPGLLFAQKDISFSRA